MAGLSKENPLRDVFNEKVVGQLALRIEENHPSFNVDEFCAETVKPFPSLGFLERRDHIKTTLRKYLPDDFPKAVSILIKSLEPELPDPGVTLWEAFMVMAECAFVAEYGREHFDISMNALYEMTKRFTAENDLRVFLEVDYEKTMLILHKWCDDESPHVRRLVSEGTRPRLPLAGRIRRFQKDPAPVIELLDKLKNDPELYVRRSVANNVNDIAKDNPDMAIALLEKWSQSKDKNIQWVVRHASRSLLKQGNPDVLKLLGYSLKVKVDVSSISLDKKEYKVGDAMKISFSITSKEEKESKLMIDYVICFLKAKGKTSEKVFKMRDIKLAPNQILKIEKIHKLKNTSGRKHYPGKHFVSLQINGVRYPEKDFFIKD